ncbi:tyrosine-type recombinase/integrase [Bacillus paranthracis]|uniref:tyrosine-type recombinase/integrase n=1 Tax=Bacillus paranthracis TaxID=2026186 RepID=UPI0015829026|nr:tyrosine-type recombinase/integrase [Bacillus paranthracis]NUJ06936.1 tyrosine-type recombinase/integrase [Bacillus paranthracis]
MKQSILKGQYIIKNNIGWLVNGVSDILHPQNNATLVAQSKSEYFEPSIQITETINIADNYWDFSDLDTLYKGKFFYKYDFQNITSFSYCVLLKRMIIRELYERENRFTTTYTFFNIAKNFILFLEGKHVVNPKLIYPKLVSEFISNEKALVSESWKRQIFSGIEKFLREVEHEYKDFNLIEFQDVLTNYNAKKIRAEMENGKTKNIPRGLLNQIIQLALKDIDNIELPLVYRMAACMIIIFSQTGMRRGEFLILEINRLEDIMIKNRKEKAYYLEFITYKTEIAKDGRWTETHMNSMAVKAYQKLVELTEERRGQTGSKVLYCSKNGTSYNRSTIQKHIKCFFSRHQKTLNFENVDLNNLSKWRVLKSDASDYRFVNLEDVGKYFYYVHPHQFRVAVANELRDKGVTLQWIKEHMNHLEEEMTKHYFRDERIIIDMFNNRASKDGKQLETNPLNVANIEIKKELYDSELKGVYEAINKFLKKKKLNVFRNLKEILSLLKSTPVRESEIGFCMNTIKLCERQEQLSMLEKWYYLRPQIVDISNFKFTLRRFDDKLKLVAHNREVAKENIKYERQYTLELTSLQHFFKNKFLPEFTLLKEQMDELDESEFILRYPELKEVILKIEYIERSIPEWLMNMK